MGTIGGSTITSGISSRANCSKLQADLPHQRSESWIGTQPVKSRIYSEERHARRALLDCLPEQLQCPGILTYPQMSERQIVGGYEPLRRCLFQISQQLHCLRSPP